MITPPVISAIILVGALVLFASERIRHDLIAVAALLACVATGLVAPQNALSGFGDPAVIAVAAVLIVGRALELTGVAGHLARLFLPRRAPFILKLSALLAIAAVLSAFMNNIAALVITMPLAIEIAQQHKLAAGATLMPLSFATILGGMTTLIGTPANLILSTVRERELGRAFGFFTMAPVGVAVCLVGLVYLAVVGWRLLPRRAGRGVARRPLGASLSWRLPARWKQTVSRSPNICATPAVACSRSSATTAPSAGPPPAALKTETGSSFFPDCRLHRRQNSCLSQSTGYDSAELGSVTSRMVVANGSPLIGEGHDAIRFRSGHSLAVVAAGPRAALLRRPLKTLKIQTGDQLFVRGPAEALATFAARMRLLEVDRSDKPPVDLRSAILAIGIFACAILAVLLGVVGPALGFLAAAALIAAFGLIPASEVYSSIDWSVIVLLGAMMPVGASFETSGAAALAANALGQTLAGVPLFVSLAALCTVTMLLSIFLNNVATSVIMAPLAIKVAILLHVNPDAMLLAVLIGVSSDFLTPIGHQNNLLVMGPGGYRFTDYTRVGAILVVLVILTAALVLSNIYG